MADKPDMGRHNVQPLVQPNVKLTKKQQKEEKKLKKEMDAKLAAEERAETLRLRLEAKEQAKKESIEKKRLQTVRVEQIAAERRRVEAEERQKREAAELKRRMANIDLNDLVPLMPAPKKSAVHRLRDAMADALKRMDVIEVLGKDLSVQLAQLVTQSSDFDLKRELNREGYSDTTKVHPARVLFDIGNSAGLTTMSVKNGERRFFSGLSRFLFSPPQDYKYRIQFDGTGVSIGDRLVCLVCRRIVQESLPEESSPPRLEMFCLNLKKMFVTNRVAWRDFSLYDVIKKIEKEPARSERLIERLQRHRVLGIPQARVLEHEHSFNHTSKGGINFMPKESWQPFICDSTEAAFEHLSDQKEVLTEFPPSLVECLCETCVGLDFTEHTTNKIAEDHSPLQVV